MRKTPATTHPEVDAVLEVLFQDVQSILAGQFTGLYLYGSLAYGGFDRASDVDFIVATQSELTAEAFEGLEDMHARIATLDSWCSTQLEGSYIPRQALRTFDPQRVYFFHIDRGRGERLQRMQVEDPRLSRAWWGGWVFLRHVLWECGLTLAGPDVRELVDPVHPGELRQAARANLEGWLAPLLDELGELAIFGYQPYCVLTVCRLLHTLDTDTVATKSEAARWAKAMLEPRWQALIDRALVDRQAPLERVPDEVIQASRDFIRYALEKTG